MLYPLSYERLNSVARLPDDTEEIHRARPRPGAARCLSTGSAPSIPDGYILAMSTNRL
jgi:hypothetical protein